MRRRDLDQVAADACAKVDSMADWSIPKPRRGKRDTMHISTNHMRGKPSKARTFRYSGSEYGVIIDNYRR